VLNYFKAVDAEKDQNSSDYLLSNLYELKINFIGCGDNLCNQTSTNIPTNIDEKTVTVQGQKIFYLEAGRENNQTILLLHGYPTSSNMYRDLIPKLADKFHLVAPDYIGYGKSSKPTVSEFEYTFEHQAQIINEFTEKIGLKKFSLYVMDYGAPIGFRIATANPEKVNSFIVQNGNAYDEGLGEFWIPIKDWWYNKTAENEEKIRQSLTLNVTKWQYTHGTRNPEAIDPSNWKNDQVILDSPGNSEIQLAMLYDYRTNVQLYPQWQQYFQEYQPPMLIVWGANDYIFPEFGAHQYKRDLKNVEIYLIDTGHFALEEDSDFIAQKISEFLN
jgi:pimeloyl-ACP methyl ester carboxylesterase